MAVSAKQRRSPNIFSAILLLEGEPLGPEFLADDSRLASDPQHDRGEYGHQQQYYSQGLSCALS